MSFDEAAEVGLLRRKNSSPRFHLRQRNNLMLPVKLPQYMQPEALGTLNQRKS